MPTGLFGRKLILKAVIFCIPLAGSTGEAVYNKFVIFLKNFVVVIVKVTRITKGICADLGNAGRDLRADL